MTASLFVAGLNHRTAPVEVRERLAFEEDKLREVLCDLHAAGILTELMIVSTCNRVEIYGIADAPGEARTAAFRHLCRQRGLELDQVEPLLYTKIDAEAVQHAFRVAASLDSMVVGEPQILGQVKDAFTIAQACQTVGPALHRLWTKAFAVAKRVRTDTDVARFAVSVSFAAVELAKKIFGGLEGRSVLLIGAGEMGELASRHLVDQGAFPIYIANRTWARAQDLARSLAGTAVPFAEIEAAMSSVDIVVTSTGAPEPIVRRDLVQRVMHARRARPLFFVDIAVPRDVEPGVNALDNVFCYDVDDLKQVVDANLRERMREAQRAEAMIRHEVDRFAAALLEGEVVPTIVSLRERLESIRQAEVAKALARLPGASDETRQVVEALSSAIVNKILHTPITKLRESTRSGQGRSWTALVHELFGLRSS